MDNSHGTAGTDTAVQKMEHSPLVSLSEIFRSQLIVRVMSARNHDFGNAMMNSFYHQNVSVEVVVVLLF